MALHAKTSSTFQVPIATQTLKPTAMGTRTWRLKPPPPKEKTGTTVSCPYTKAQRCLRRASMLRHDYGRNGVRSAHNRVQCIRM